ncbi:TTC28 [Symbiodinium natans]|uniref:TTC28 protein n=1 Tax=Symbiodinium natans TaxID=878477 RepID=A0A812M3G8_9DINO|nr:TTC28 [Symbiodinium natans]
MAVITEVESDDELPPLVGSGSQATTASHTASPPKQDKAPSFSKEAQKAQEDEDDDDDELPPLISSAAPAQKVEPPARREEVPASKPVAPADSKVAKTPVEEVRQKPQPSSPSGPSGPPSRGLAGLGSAVPAPVPKEAKAAAPAAPAPAVPAPTDLSSTDRIAGKDDLDDALDVLEDGHYEEAELLAGEVQRQAAQDGNAEREADALRVVTKAQIKAAEEKGFEGLPDIEVLEQALKAANSEIFTFEKHGEIVAKVPPAPNLSGVLPRDTMQKAHCLDHVGAVRGVCPECTNAHGLSLDGSNLGGNSLQFWRKAPRCSAFSVDPLIGVRRLCLLPVTLLQRLSAWWCDFPPQTQPALSRGLLLFAFLIHAYLWQGGFLAFWHDLTGSNGEVDLEAKEGGLHEFPEHLSSRMSREANIHPAVLMPFLVSFDMPGGPNSMPEATASIFLCLRRMQICLLLSWLGAIVLLLCLHVRGEQATCSLRVMASVATLTAACLNFYFQGFSARLTDPLVPAWAMLVVAFAQLADGGRTSESFVWAGRWCKKLMLGVLCLSYFLAGCYKLRAAGLSWMGGSVLEHYARLYMSAEPWSEHLFTVLCRVHAWPVLSTCGLLFELLCPLALFNPSLRAPMIGMAIVFHLGNLFLIALNGDRFLTWVWMLLFVLDFPASLVNKPIAEPSLVPSSDDAFLLPVPPMPPRTSSTSRPSQAAKARKVSRVGGLSLETHLQTAYGLCTAVVVMIWLGVGLPRAANLVHTDWPFVGPDMFSRVGSWSSPSPFRDVLFNQMVRPQEIRSSLVQRMARRKACRACMSGVAAQGNVTSVPSFACENRCVGCAELQLQAHNAASEGAQAVRPAQEASKLRERMGDPKGAALAACEEAKGYYGAKAQAATRKAALNAVALAKEACDSKTEALAWYCACLAHSAAGQKLDAVKAGRQALTLAREVRDVETIGIALQALMQANGEEDKAASIAEEELMMAKKVGDRRREAYAQLKMAQSMIAQDRPREALRRATEAADKLREMGDLKGEAKATQLLVEIQCQARRAMEASRTAKEAQRLFKEAGDMKGCVGVLQLLTSLHLEAGDPHSAVQAARDQVKLFREAGYKEEEASATLGLAEMTQQTMGPRDALRLAKDAATMFRTAGDPAGEARALSQVAQMHLGLKAHTNAMQTAKQAEELARRSGDEKVLITALQAVGEAYSSADRFTEGIDAAKEALQMVEKAPVKEDAARAAALACMSNVQLQVAHYDVNNPGARIRPRGLKEALKAAEEALELHRKLGDRNGEINGIQRIFHAHLLSQDGPNSLRYAREYMDLAQASEQKENLGSALVSLCQGHFLCRNWDEAERANLEARAIFEKARMHENIEVCDQIMREMKQEMERDRRPSQPMGRANAAQGAGGGYNSLLPERQASRLQQDGVPSGGFRGVPAGGFGNSESTQVSQAQAPSRSAAASEKTAKGFSEGLRGAFSKGQGGAMDRAKTPSGAHNTSNSSSYSSYSATDAIGNGLAGRTGSSASTGSRSTGGYGGRSSGYTENAGSRYGASGYGSNHGTRGVPAGGFGKSGVPAGGFGASQGVPAAGRPGVQAGGFGGAGAAGGDPKARPGRSAFAGFAGTRGLGRGEE